MKSPSIRYTAAIAVIGSICFLLAVMFFGWAQQMASSMADVPNARNDSAHVTVGAEPVQQPIAAAPRRPRRTKAAVASEPAKADQETVTIGACDGGKPIEVPNELKGKALADRLMEQWKKNHPEVDWVAEEKQKHALQPPADNSELLKGEQGKGHTYGNFTERDLLIWARETEKFVAEGSRIFHSAEALGSTVGVSCDMCHPHAANTHPETYPKFQTQLGRVALLRDMIDWCIENPVRGKHVDADSPTMRALEAYIQAQRKGVPMNYGKH